MSILWYIFLALVGVGYVLYRLSELKRIRRSGMELLEDYSMDGDSQQEVGECSCPEGYAYSSLFGKCYDPDNSYLDFISKNTKAWKK